MTVGHALGMKRLALTLAMGALLFGGRVICRTAVRADGVRPVPTVAAVAPTPALPEPPKVESLRDVKEPRRLLRYETYIAWDGRKCWLNRANEQVCEP